MEKTDRPLTINHDRGESVATEHVTQLAVKQATVIFAEIANQAARHDDPAASMGLPDFCDRRVFVVSASYSDRHTAMRFGADDFTVHQSCDGPTYIVIGQTVTDERLAENLVTLSERYGVTLGQLHIGRAGGVVRVRGAQGAAI